MTSGAPEAPAVTRDLTLAFSSVFSPTVDGLSSQPPEWGSDTLGGAYRETLAGLHRDPIFVQGRFLLRRVAATPELNQPELNP